VMEYGADTSWRILDQTNTILEMSKNVPGSVVEYIRSVYFVSVAVSTEGYGDIRAVNTQETLAATLILLVVGYVYPALIGCIASLISSDDDAHAASIQHTQTANELVNGIEASQTLRLRFTNYIHYIVDSGRECAGSEMRVLSLLPSGLRMDVSNYIHDVRKQHCRSMLTRKNSTFGRGEVSRWLISRMKSKIYLPSDNVLIRGETFDQLYMVDSGMLCMHHAETGKLVALFGVGDQFGEYALVRRQTQHDTLWSVLFSTCMVLSREDFRAVMKEFPVESRHIVTEIRERHRDILNAENKKAMRKISRRFHSMRSTSTESAMARLNEIERRYLLSFLGDQHTFGRDLQRNIKRGSNLNLLSFRHPQSQNWTRISWNLMVFLGIVLESILLPLYLCFDIQDNIVLDIVLMFIDLCYSLNVVMNFSIFAVLSQGLIITNLKSVFALRIRTLSGFRQIVAGFPVYVNLTLFLFLLIFFFYVIHFNKYIRYWLMRWWFPSETLLLHLAHTIRVLRFPDASHIWSNLETVNTARISNLRSIFQILKIFGLLILSAHYVACAFYSIASVNMTEDCEGLCMWNGTWIEKQIAERHIEEDGGNVFVWYSRSLYWAVATMVVVVIGDVTPVTVQETMYVLVTILIGVLVNAAIIGNLISFMSVSNTTHGKYRRLAEQLSRYASRNEISIPLQKKIAHCMAYQWETSEWQRQLDRLCIDGLPRSLRLGVNRHLGGTLIFSCPIFSPLIAAQADINQKILSGGNMDDDMSTLPASAIKRLILSLRFKMYSPGDTILSSCDRASEMYVLCVCVCVCVSLTLNSLTHFFLNIHILTHYLLISKSRYIVRHGRVQIMAPEIESYLESDPEYNLKLPNPSILRRGSYFGEISLTNGSFTYGFQAIARSFVELCVVSRSDFIQALRDNPQVHLDICLRINSWSGYQWLEQLSVEAASIMSQSTLDMDATCNEFNMSDQRRGSGSPIKRAGKAGGFSLGRHNKAETRRSTSATLDISQFVNSHTASVGFSFDEESLQQLKQRFEHSIDDKEEVGGVDDGEEDWVFENTNTGRILQKISDRVPYLNSSKQLIRKLSRQDSRRQMARRIKRAIELKGNDRWYKPFWQRQWECMCSILMIYNVISVTYRASISSEVRDDATLIFDTFVDMFFILDTYFRAQKIWIISNGKIQKSSQDIFRVYFSSPWCILDLVLSLPLSLLGRIFGASAKLEMCLRLPQIFRIFKIRVHVETIRQMLEPFLGASFVELLIVLALFVLSNHLCACVWVVSHRYIESSSNRTWAVEEGMCDATDHESCGNGGKFFFLFLVSLLHIIITFFFVIIINSYQVLPKYTFVHSTLLSQLCLQ